MGLYDFHFNTMYARFVFADIRKIDKVFAVMRKLAEDENDGFFADALAEYLAADIEEKAMMCKRLVEIFNEAKQDGMDLEMAVYLAAFPA